MDGINTFIPSRYAHGKCYAQNRIGHKTKRRLNVVITKNTYYAYYCTLHRFNQIRFIKM